MEEDKLSPVDATLKAMQEVTGPVIAIVLVLCAVFIPVAFLGGLTGQNVQAIRHHHRHVGGDFRHVALTLTPRCARCCSSLQSSGGACRFDRRSITGLPA